MKGSQATRVPVLLPLAVDRPFTYAWELPDPPLPGRYVEVPVGGRQAVGVVWDGPPTGLPERARLRSVIRSFALPPMPRPLRRLLAQLARETLAPLGAALRLALVLPEAVEPPRTAPRLTLAAWPEGLRLTPARARVRELLADGRPRTAAEIARSARTSASTLERLLRAGALAPVEEEDPREPEPHPDTRGLVLEPDQRRAADALACAVRASRFACLVLEGVPGSGKTEVYFEAVAEALRCGRSVLVLLPEIALSAQWIARFTRRFGTPPLLWHSALSRAQRRATWRRIASGRARVVVGARSALFLPLADLGLIVIDEEHDASFKQEEGIAYDARIMAEARARLECCPLVRVSATPSVESAYRSGRIAGFAPPRPWPRLRLSARIGGRAMPEVHLVDLRRDRPAAGAFLAPSLLSALEQTLSAGEQALVFLNRRGFAPLVLCRACGTRLRCPNCSAWLTLHRLRRRLLCHHCGYRRAEPDHCPLCGTVDGLVPCGPGVERVAEEIGERFAGARIAVATSDTVRNLREVEELVRAVTERRVDVLIGTQMLAKGHHFPGLTLVGVVDADVGLGGELHGAERSFQLLFQVAGRAGRGSRPGRVLIQTHLPEHPVLQALARGDEEAFYRAELAARKEAGLPPFGRLAALILAAREAQRVRDLARELARSAPLREGVTVLGPAPAPLMLLRGRYRERFLVKARPGVDLPAYLRDWLARVRIRSGVRLRVDVDPQSFL